MAKNRPRYKIDRGTATAKPSRAHIHGDRLVSSSRVRKAHSSGVASNESTPKRQRMAEQKMEQDQQPAAQNEIHVASPLGNTIPQLPTDLTCEYFEGKPLQDITPIANATNNNTASNAEILSAQPFLGSDHLALPATPCSPCPPPDLVMADPKPITEYASEKPSLRLQLAQMLLEQLQNERDGVAAPATSSRELSSAALLAPQETDSIAELAAQVGALEGRMARMEEWAENMDGKVSMVVTSSQQKENAQASKRSSSWRFF